MNPMKDHPPFTRTGSFLSVLSLMLILGLANANAEPPISSSASFTLLSAEPGAGGGHVANGGATISAEISVGDGIAGGVSNVTTGGAQTKGGFTGQLYDAQSLAVSADPAVVNENSSTQLSAVATMDDDTLVSVSGSDARWSILEGPLDIIALDGLATAGEVFINSPATTAFLKSLL